MLIVYTTFAPYSRFLPYVWLQPLRVERVCIFINFTLCTPQELIMHLRLRHDPGIHKGVVLDKPWVNLVRFSRVA